MEANLWAELPWACMYLFLSYSLQKNLKAHQKFLGTELRCPRLLYVSLHPVLSIIPLTYSHHHSDRLGKLPSARYWRERVRIQGIQLPPSHQQFHGLSFLFCHHIKRSDGLRSTGLFLSFRSRVVTSPEETEPVENLFTETSSLYVFTRARGD